MNKLLADDLNSRPVSKLTSNPYFSNATWLIAERLVRLLITAIVGLYVARYLGPVQFGALSFASSYLAIFTVLASLGLDAIVIRDLVNKSREQAVIMGTAFFLKMAGSVILWIFLWASFLLFKFSAQDKLLIGILAAGVIFQSLLVIDFYFQSKVESKYVSRIRLAQVGLSSVLKLVLISCSADLIWFAVVLALDNVYLAFGLYVTFLRRGGNVMIWRFSASVAKQMLNQSLPLLVYAFFVLAVMNCDQIMIKFLRSESEVGWYAAAAMISSVWYFIPVALGSTFNPYIIENVREKAADDKTRLLFSILFAVTVAGALAVYFAAPAIINTLFSADYQPAAPVLSVLILNGIFVFHVSIRSRVLVARGNQWISTVIMLGTLVFNIAGNLILIPNYGAVGAAWSSVISWGISVVLLPLMFSASRGFVEIFFRPRFTGLGDLVNALRG